MWDAYLIVPNICGLFSDNALIYFGQAIYKAIKQTFSYDKKATWERVKNQKILLPIQNNQIAFNYMETFIKAIQKLVIKDLVEWKDKELKAYKDVVKK